MVSTSGFALNALTPWLLVPLFGIAYSLVPSAMWPAVAKIVGEPHPPAPPKEATRPDQNKE